MRLNKKGNSTTIAIWILVAFVVIGGSYYAFVKEPAQQTGVGTTVQPGVQCTSSSDCNSGYSCNSAGQCVFTSSTLGQAGINLRAYDFVASSNRQLPVPYYVWETSDPDTVASGTLSATTYTALTGITEQTPYTLLATNDSVIGFPTEHTVSGETTDSVNLDVYERAQWGQILYVSGGKEIKSNPNQQEFNLTISNGASGTDDVDYIQFKQNHTNKATLLAGFFFDMQNSDANVSVSSVTSSGTVSRGSASSPIVPGTLSEGSMGVTLDSNYGQEIHKSSAKDDYYIFLNSQDPITASAEVNGYRPVLLFNNDYVRTGVVTFEADSSGCPNGLEGEVIDIYAFDVGFFQSLDAGTKDKLLAGYENDASTTSDVGASDFKGPKIYCTSG